jgi:hypothetical protein
MKPSRVMLPRFEYAYGDASLRVSPVKCDNLASTAASFRLLEVLANSHLTIEADAVAVPNNPAPRLLSEGYAAVVHA